MTTYHPTHRAGDYATRNAPSYPGSGSNEGYGSDPERSARIPGRHSQGGYRGRGSGRGAKIARGKGRYGSSSTRDHESRSNGMVYGNRMDSPSDPRRIAGPPRSDYDSLHNSPAETFTSLPARLDDLSDPHRVNNDPCTIPGPQLNPCPPRMIEPAKEDHIPSSPSIPALDSLDNLMRYHARLEKSRSAPDPSFEQSQLASIAESFLRGNTSASGSEGTLVDSAESDKAKQLPAGEEEAEEGELPESPLPSTIAARAMELKEELLKKKRKAQWEASMIKQEIVDPPLPPIEILADVAAPRAPKKQRLEDHQPTKPQSLANRISAPSQTAGGTSADHAQPKGKGKKSRKYGTRSPDDRSRPSFGKEEVYEDRFKPSATNFVPERFRKQSGSTDSKSRSGSPPRLIVHRPSTSTVGFESRSSMNRTSVASLYPGYQATSDSHARSSYSGRAVSGGAYIPPAEKYEYHHASAYDAEGRFIGSSRRDTDSTWASVYRDDEFPAGSQRPGRSPLRVQYTRPSPAPARQLAPPPPPIDTNVATQDVLTALNLLKEQIAKLEAQLPLSAAASEVPTHYHETKDQFPAPARQSIQQSGVSRGRDYTPPAVHQRPYYPRERSISPSRLPPMDTRSRFEPSAPYDRYPPARAAYAAPPAQAPRDLQDQRDASKCERGQRGGYAPRSQAPSTRPSQAGPPGRGIPQKGTGHELNRRPFDHGQAEPAIAPETGRPIDHPGAGRRGKLGKRGGFEGRGRGSSRGRGR